MTDADFYRRYLHALDEIHDSFDSQKTENAVVNHAAMLFGGRIRMIRSSCISRRNSLTVSQAGWQLHHKERGQ